MPSPQDLSNWLKRFAPEVRYHSEEKYFPCSVDWYLQRTKLLDGSGVLFNRMNPAQDPAQGRSGSAALADSHYEERRDFTLNVLEVENGDKPNTYGGNLSTAKCYCWAQPVKGSNGVIEDYDLNYWFFHAWNGNIFNVAGLAAYVAGALVLTSLLWFITPWLFVVAGSIVGLVGLAAFIGTLPGVDMHEGDWEGVVVRVKSSGDFSKMYFFQHGAGAWVTAPAKTGSGQIVVYSALNSHASYPAADTYKRIMLLANDHTSEGGVIWNTAEHLMEVGHDDLASVSAVMGSSSVSVDSGDSFPAISVNDNSLFVKVHREKKDLVSDIGVYHENTLAVQWGPGKVKFDTGCVGDPVVAIDNAGIVLSVHQGTSGGIWYNLGLLNTQNPAKYFIDWGTTLNKGKKFQSTSAQPTLAMNNLGVVLYGFQSGSESKWGLGTLDGQKKSIDWSSNTFTLASKGEVSVAINDVAGLSSETQTQATIPDCDAIAVFSDDGGNLSYALGVITSQGTQLHWEPPIRITLQGNQTAQKGTRPRVSINDHGMVVVVHLETSVLKGHIGQWTRRPDEDPMGPGMTILWTPFDPHTSTDCLGGAIGLTQDQTVVLLKQNTQKSYSAGAAKIADLDANSWEPLNGQDWMKYSGHWGQIGSGYFSISPFGLSKIKPGPTGPAFKSNWVFGPDTH